MIEFVNVSKVYKATGTRALSNFNVSIDRGEFVFVVGPSGAGKSTFIKLLMREEKPTSGEISSISQTSGAARPLLPPHARGGVPGFPAHPDHERL